MKILFITASSGSRGGGEIHQLYVAEGLRQLGHEVALWASAHPRMDELCEKFSCLGHVLRGDYTNLYDTWHRGLLPWAVRTHRAKTWLTQWEGTRADVIHVNKQCLEDGLDLLDAVSQATSPSLCMVHITQSARWLGSRFGRLRDWRARHVLARYPGLFVTSPDIRKADLDTFLGTQSPTQIIYNGVPPASPLTPDQRTALRLDLGLSPNRLAVVAVGRLEAQKRPLLFLHQLRRMLDAGLSVEGHWLGGGRLQSDWDREVTSLGLAQHLRHHPWRDDVRSLLPAFDLFLHPALFEGLPLALLEAMHAGLPCSVSPEVARDLPTALHEHVHVHQNGSSWTDFFASPTRLTALGQAGRKHVLAHHSTASMAAAFESLYRRLLSAPPSGRAPAPLASVPSS